LFNQQGQGHFNIVAESGVNFPKWQLSPEQVGFANSPGKLGTNAVGKRWFGLARELLNQGLTLVRREQRSRLALLVPGGLRVILRLIGDEQPELEPDGRNDQHTRPHADPQRPRQPDCEAAGFGRDWVGGGHAARILPADAHVNPSCSGRGAERGHP
jgi:hypothetical protein